ncbi:HNH endonuclease [Sphaerisporangium perillae]|uniref:HNH endonuclease n=1 Tax=Sphaerisporangium perillae TaxID=2935860 RepID=UPI003557BB39
MYRVSDSEYVSAVIDTVARIQRREIVGSPGQRDTAKTTQHIKSEVWRRDQGRCVECGSTSYLEFDHVIPRSKGGVTSAGNLQLLCRACNLRKSDRI